MTVLSYRRHRFPPSIIQHAIWLYLRLTHRSIASVRFSSAIGGRGHPGVSDKESANANPLHQGRRVDALIPLNDMTSFPRDEEQLVHTGASMQVRQWVGR
jgi:hypothetical protein